MRPTRQSWREPTPFAYGYYFVTFLYPITVVVTRATAPATSPLERAAIWSWLTACLVLLAFNLPISNYHLPQALGKGAPKGGGCGVAVFGGHGAPSFAEPSD